MTPALAGACCALPADRDDNLEQQALAQLALWDEQALSERLSKVANKEARALLAALLAPLPSDRPASVAELLQAPFFTASGLLGNEAPTLPPGLSWHFFISHAQARARAPRVCPRARLSGCARPAANAHGRPSARARQAEAGDACMSLKLLVEKHVPGARIWFDQDEKPSEARARPLLGLCCGPLRIPLGSPLVP